MNTRLIINLVLAILVVAPLWAQGPPPRKPYASQCGSEIAWEADFETALRKAKAEKKMVFWFVPTGYRTAMDRRQEVYWNAMAGMFMDQGMIAFINERCIPLRLGFRSLVGRRKPAGIIATVPRKKAKALAERYELAKFQYIAPGFLLLDPAGELIHTCDRLTTYNASWMRARMNAILAKHKKKLGALSKPLIAPKPTEALATAYSFFAAGDFERASSSLDATLNNPRRPVDERVEAMYLQGAALHRRGMSTKGDAAWTKAIALKPDSRWAWKSKIELDRWGPFTKGLEFLRDFPEHAHGGKDQRTSRAPGDATKPGVMAKSAVQLLLSLQRENGSWDDSIYDFGGIDSLPNVYVAVTAIAAHGLLEWRHLAPKKIDLAVMKAAAFLRDEENVNEEDNDELVWAHGYRIAFFEAMARRYPKERPAARKKVAEIVRLVSDMPRRKGTWAHEYPNVFATAHVILALEAAKRLDVPSKNTLYKDAAEGLEANRGQDGGYSYSTGRRASSADGSAGRMPLCEYALWIAKGRKNGDNLAKAIDHGLKKHIDLERVRKYDDHADRNGNGGFFFWFDMQARALAMSEAPVTPQRRAQWMKSMREIIASIYEADGGWIDSHELGKSYGTAMGLLTLSIVSTQRQ